MEPLIWMLVRITFYGLFLWTAVVIIIAKIIVPRFIAQVALDAGSVFEMIAMELSILPPQWKKLVFTYVANTGELLALATTNIFGWWSPKLATFVCDELHRVQGFVFQAAFPGFKNSSPLPRPWRQISQASARRPTSQHRDFVDQGSIDESNIEADRSMLQVLGTSTFTLDSVETSNAYTLWTAARPVARVSMDDNCPLDFVEEQLLTEWNGNHTDDSSSSGYEQEYEEEGDQRALKDACMGPEMEHGIEEPAAVQEHSGISEESDLAESASGMRVRAVWGLRRTPPERDGKAELEEFVGEYAGQDADLDEGDFDYEWECGHRPKAVASLRDEDFGESLEVAPEPRARVLMVDVASYVDSRDYGRDAGGADGGAHDLTATDDEMEAGMVNEKLLEGKEKETEEATFEGCQERALRAKKEYAWRQTGMNGGHGTGESQALRHLALRVRLTEGDNSENSSNEDETEEDGDGWQDQPLHFKRKSPQDEGNPLVSPEDSGCFGESPLMTATGLKVLTSPSPRRSPLNLIS